MRLFQIVLISLLSCKIAESDTRNPYDVGNLGDLRVEVAKRRRYLLYDVNSGEGFNLRRDVYMRVAVLVTKLLVYDDWVLVLPPWGGLYHWKSSDIGQQIMIPWSKFFQVSSLNNYVPVIEMKQYMKETENNPIDQVYYLQHYPNMFEDGKWEEKYQVDPCLEDADSRIYDETEGRFKGYFWGFKSISAKKFNCVSLQGQASTLIPLIVDSNSTSIMFDRAEIMLHDFFGDANFWKVRRSMRFAKELRDVADKFRLKYLNSSDLTDSTEISEDWRDVNLRNSGSVVGGPYIAAHLRRQDFLYGRGKQVPSIKYAAKQLQNVSNTLNLTKIFIATDADAEDFEELKSYLPGVIRFEPTFAEREKFKDGGIAIIDQWICAHARYFTGTFESTFSFRIQEEREILGFNVDTTFNRLCGDGEKQCEQPARWKIVY